MIDVNAFRALVAGIRPIASPLHTTRVTVRTRTWNGGEIGTGVYSDEDFLLGQEVGVSKLTQKEILTSGGYFSFNDVKVTHITPPFAGGGYSLAQIAPASQIPSTIESKLMLSDTGGVAADPAVEYIYILSGEINGDYRLVTVGDDKALHYTLFLHELDVSATAHGR
jgi:hypothetical protein